jgi:hypothetical protein
MLAAGHRRAIASIFLPRSRTLFRVLAGPRSPKMLYCVCKTFFDIDH